MRHPNKWRAERLLVQLPRYRAPEPKRAATEEESDPWDLLDEDATRSVLAHADVQSLSNLVKVNRQLNPNAKAALWTALFRDNNGSIPRTEAAVTDMHIDRYLKADGFGVRALADACRRFSNLVRLHAHGCKVDLAAIKELDPPRSLGQVRKHVTGPASASAHGLVLAVYAVAELLADQHATLKVPDSAFEIYPFKNTITSIEVPKGFTAIGENAFFGCTSLASVVLPARLTSIGYSAFNNCSSLASVVFPAGLTSIGHQAFTGCTSLASVVLYFSAGLTSISDEAFAGCTALASVELPAGLTSIGDYAFIDCTTLASVDLPAGLTSIGDHAFMNCSSLASVVLPAGLTSIGASAFQGTSLTSVELPTGIITIGEEAFPSTIVVRKAPGL